MMLLQAENAAWTLSGSYIGRAFLNQNPMKMPQVRLLHIFLVHLVDGTNDQTEYQGWSPELDDELLEMAEQVVWAGMNRCCETDEGARGASPSPESESHEKGANTFQSCINLQLPPYRPTTFVTSRALA